MFIIFAIGFALASVILISFNINVKLSIVFIMFAFLSLILSNFQRPKFYYIKKGEFYLMKNIIQNSYEFVDIEKIYNAVNSHNNNYRFCFTKKGCKTFIFTITDIDEITSFEFYRVPDRYINFIMENNFYE